MPAETPGRSAHAAEVAQGARFEFGENWRRFLATVDDERMRRAENALRDMLETSSLAGRRFLDIGCGSGLSSLAARRLGATVHSFDYDPSSVACTRELRRRYCGEDAGWTVEEGSVLDREYLAGLGLYDIVYSWGVLHHTGRMWEALDNVHSLVAPGGRLFIAIYNDLGSRSARWRTIKRTYNRLPAPLRLPFAITVSAPDEAKALIRALLRGRPGEYVERWRQPSTVRGMSRWRDIVDWVGGYPYEVATPEAIFDFYRARGFTLARLLAGGVGLGCNEFVFIRTTSAAEKSA